MAATPWKQYDPGVYQQGNLFSTSQTGENATTREDWIKAHPGDKDVFDIGGFGAASRKPAPTPPPTVPPPADQPGPTPPPIPPPTGGGGGGGGGITPPIAGLQAAAPEGPTAPDMPPPEGLQQRQMSVGRLGMGMRTPPSLQMLISGKVY